MPVPSPRIRIALNRRICRNGHRPRIALIAIRRKVDIRQRLRPAHHHIRNPNIRPLILPAPKIRMQPNRPANKANDGAGIGIHRRRGNIFVPKIRVHERTKPVQTSPLYQTDRTARRRAATSTTSTTTATRSASPATRCRPAAAAGHYRGQSHYRRHTDPLLPKTTHTNSFSHPYPNRTHESGPSTCVIGTCTSGGPTSVGIVIPIGALASRSEASVKRRPAFEQAASTGCPVFVAICSDRGGAFDDSVSKAGAFGRRSASALRIRPHQVRRLQPPR